MYCISIFGSSGHPDDVDYYHQLVKLGVFLSDHNIEINVGSTTGVVGAVLEGVNKGCNNCNVRLISYGDQRYIDGGDYDKLVVKDDYFSRLKLLCESDVFIILDGHLGTMAETMVAWNLMQSQKEFDKKILVFGKNEEKKIRYLSNELSFSNKEYLNVIEVASNVSEIIDMAGALINRK